MPSTTQELNEDSDDFLGALRAAAIERRATGGPTTYLGPMYTAFKRTKDLRKLHYVVCSDRTLEIHESERTFKKGSRTTHLVDLATVYSLSVRENEKLPYCMVLVTPDQTLFLRAPARDATSLWYVIIFNGVYTSRVIVPDKFLPRENYPENTWDVKVVDKTKSYGYCSHSANLAMKEPRVAGKKRLSLYRDSIALIELNEEPMDVYKTVDHYSQYTKTPQYLLFLRSRVMYYGNRGRHFIFCIGSIENEKAQEVILETESEETANEIKSKMQTIINRETSNIPFALTNSDEMPSETTSLRLPTKSDVRPEGRCHTQPSSSREAKQDLLRRNNNKASWNKTNLLQFFGLLRKRLSSRNDLDSSADFDDDDLESGMMKPVAEWVANRVSLVGSGTENENDSGGTLRMEDYLNKPSVKKVIQNRKEDIMRHALLERGRFDQQHTGLEMRTFSLAGSSMSSSVSSSDHMMGLLPSTSSTSALDSCISGTSGDGSASSSVCHNEESKARKHRQAERRERHKRRELKRSATHHHDHAHPSINGSVDSCYSSINNQKEGIRQRLQSNGVKSTSSRDEHRDRNKRPVGILYCRLGIEKMSRSADNLQYVNTAHSMRPGTSLRTLSPADIERMEQDMKSWMASVPRPRKKRASKTAKEAKKRVSHSPEHSVVVKTPPPSSSRHMSVSSQSTQRSSHSRNLWEKAQIARSMVDHRANGRDAMDCQMSESVHSMDCEMQSRTNSMESQRSFVSSNFGQANKHLIPQAKFLDDVDTQPAPPRRRMRRHKDIEPNLVRAQCFFSNEAKEEMQRMFNERKQRYQRHDRPEMPAGGIRSSVSYHSGCQVIDEESNYIAALPNSSAPTKSPEQVVS